MEYNDVRISKDTQKFIGDVSNLSPEKHNKVMRFLEGLEHQQNAEANLENKRGWRYMWQRTPKPYLLMLGYLVFFGSVGSFGYGAFSHAGENQIIFLLVLALIMVVPIIPVAYLSYNYIKNSNKKNIEENQQETSSPTKS